MYILNRRRQFFGIGMVTITYHGFGGETAAGDVVVTETVPKGSLWLHIPKPEFVISGSAKKQSGYTLLEGDDTTLIPSDYVVTSDMQVFASYTAIEVGIITKNGEIMSVEGWISKYGMTLFVYNEPADDYIIIPELKDNLIIGIYFKVSDDFCPCIIPQTRVGNQLIGVSIGSSLPLGGSDIDLSLYGGLSENAREVQDGAGRHLKIMPYLHTPPDWSTQGIPEESFDRIRNQESGKSLTVLHRDACIGHTDTFGTVGSPGCEFVLNLSWLPAIRKGDVYFASANELRIISNNIGKAKSINDKLHEWRDSISGDFFIDDELVQLPYIYSDNYKSGHLMTGFDQYIKAMEGSPTYGNTVMYQVISGRYSQDGELLSSIFNFAPYRHIDDTFPTDAPNDPYANYYPKRRNENGCIVVSNISHIFNK